MNFEKKDEFWIRMWILKKKDDFYQCEFWNKICEFWNKTCEFEVKCELKKDGNNSSPKKTSK